MMPLKKISSYLVILILLFSCNNSEKKLTKTDANYSMTSQGKSVGWTAYKFTEKVGVKGVFDDFEIKTASDSVSIETLLKTSRISIKTQSVNSKLEIRDVKLRDVFFNTFNTEIIKGEILNADSGKGILALSMNDITEEIAYNYNLKEDTLFVNTNLHLIKWKAEKALDTLNKVCYDLHKGADGVSKLWPDVSIVIKIPVTKN
ncbi:hypothetical protein [Psychroserpens ponticola]|uniref:Lipid/polyisoprenoid-binding YceI-like domain-containing protein n=1 Tax=Psychroserpens ponticola TaxID=2932268 RepID=A0ABY7S0I0_9FLAO|nr:hypothetical protein [Psychroserpens ponticola]WCO02894.1 hypothetical protein MUN68_005225 [Psychroserpens ponticola]